MQLEVVRNRDELQSSRYLPGELNQLPLLQLPLHRRALRRTAARRL